MPVRLTIHSSLVSSRRSKSALVRMRSGAYAPTAAMRAGAQTIGELTVITAPLRRRQIRSSQAASDELSANSAVRAPLAYAASTARSMRAAFASSSRLWRSSIAADSMAAVGLAMLRPAMSGAVPLIGS